MRSLQPMCRIPPGGILLMVSTRWRGLGNEEEAAVSEAVENKALVRRSLEAHAKGDLDTLEGLLAHGFAPSPRTVCL